MSAFNPTQFSLVCLLILSLSVPTVSAQESSFFEKIGDLPVLDSLSYKVGDPLLSNKRVNYPETPTLIAVNEDGVIMGARVREDASFSSNLIHVSIDTGKSWLDVTPNLPEPRIDNLSPGLVGQNRSMSVMALHAIGNAFILQYSHRVTGDSPILRSTDNGQSWERIELAEDDDSIEFPEPSKGCADASTQFLLSVHYSQNSMGKSVKESYRSDDLGVTWSKNDPELVVTDNWVTPRDPDLYILPADGVLYTKEKWNQVYPDQQITRYSSQPIAYRIRDNRINYEGEQVAIIYQDDKSEYKTGASDLPKKGLASSTDGGKSWQIVTSNVPDEIHFVDCQSRPYNYFFISENNYKLVRSENRGRSWGDTGVFPVAVDPYATTFGQDGYLYVFKKQSTEFYRSREVVCCTDEGKPIVLNDDCLDVKYPTLEPIKITIPSDKQSEWLSTGIFLEVGDYICFSIITDHIAPSQKIDLWHAGNEYPLTNFTLNGRDCDNIPDDLGVSWMSRNLIGTYFATQNTGEVLIKYAQRDPTVNEYEISAYRLSEVQHLQRNCFNKCHVKEPSFLFQQASDTEKLSGEWYDGQGGFGTYLFKRIIDNSLESCYHTGGEDYRGVSKEALGSQCVYAYQTKELVNNTINRSLGTYDYGYSQSIDDTWLHLVLDVFPHIAYLIAFPDFRYAETPSSNLYD